MRSFRQRNPRRLGPLVVYDGATPGDSHPLMHAFLADPFEPSAELLLAKRRNEDPVDPWFRCGAVLEGVAEGWHFTAAPCEPGVHLLDLVTCDLTADDRETVAFALLHAARLSEWRDSDWFPRVHDGYFSFSGEVLLSAAWSVPPGQRAHERWGAPFRRETEAAALAACLIGENAFRTCLAAAKSLAGGGGDLAHRTQRTSLIVELIDVLLTPHTSRGRHLVPALMAQAPARATVAAVLQRGATVFAADALAWERERAGLQPADLADLAPLDGPPPYAIERDFTVEGELLLYGASGTHGCSLRALPAAGPFRDLIAVRAITPHRDEVPLDGLLDPWGAAFDVSGSPDRPLAIRVAAPLPMPAAATPEARVRVALHAARAVAFAPPLMTPAFECLSTTVDGRVCADGLEPDAATQRFHGTPRDWRDAWAIVLVRLALGPAQGAAASRAEAVLGEIEEGVAVVFSGDDARDASLRRVVRTLTSDDDWTRVQQEVAAACASEGERLPPVDDAEVRGRLSFVERERARLLAAARGGSAQKVPPR